MTRESSWPFFLVPTSAIVGAAGVRLLFTPDAQTQSTWTFVGVALGMAVIFSWSLREVGKYRDERPSYLLAAHLGAAGVVCLVFSNAESEFDPGSWWEGLWLEVGAALLLGAIVDIVVEYGSGESGPPPSA